jgi:hypothetical protein
MPLLRSEIFDFVEIHNGRRIRKDNKRPNHLSGVPDQLYEGIQGGQLVDNQYGKPVDLDLVDSLLETLDGFDLNAYLTPSTIEWFDERIQQVGHRQAPEVWEFLEIFPTPRNVIPQWYRDLLEAARAFVNGGGVLCVAPKPRKAYGWIARTIITEAIKHEAETTGLELAEESFSSGDSDSDFYTNA